MKLTLELELSIHWYEYSTSPVVKALAMWKRYMEKYKRGYATYFHCNMGLSTFTWWK